MDLPGCYSLLAHSAEEEAARDFLCFGGADCTVAVCDATCLERNLNLVLQILEITPNLVVCVNLLDEAKRKGIEVDLIGLSQVLGVPVVGAAARDGQGLDALMDQVAELCAHPLPPKDTPIIRYSSQAEEMIRAHMPTAQRLCGGQCSPRWLAARLVEGPDPSLRKSLMTHLAIGPEEQETLCLPVTDKKEVHTHVDATSLCESCAICCTVEKKKAERAYTIYDAISSAALTSPIIDRQSLRDSMAASVVHCAERIARQVTASGSGYSQRDRKIDKVLTSPLTGFPIMLLMLLGIFWLTVTGANAPSQLLSRGLFFLGDWLREWTIRLGAPGWLTGILWDGIYKTLAWVVSVMLPPMAIFFPLFTLLEDLGYLPRVAFNMDRCFQRCGACGKQALTSCMSLGCNAAGVVGCRIIDSPRERLIAMITSNFIPCNGRLPMLISLISMFFVGAVGGLGETVLSAVLLVAVIAIGIAMTFAVSKLLSATVLKGVPSSFALELPPYRRPQIGRVIIRSIFDRTLFVLGRAVSVAAPAGLVIWLLANIQVGNTPLLDLCAGFLDPFARVFGLDGVILLAFILGLPANEIVIPLIIMAYLSQGSLVEITDLTALRALLIDHGWTWVTALCVIIFSVMHWPCSTTCITIRKESQSWKWTGVAIAVPTLCGLALCFLVNGVCRLLC